MGKHAERVQTILCFDVDLGPPNETSSNFISPQRYSNATSGAIMSGRKRMLAGTNQSGLASQPSTPIPFQSYPSAEESAHNPVCNAEVPSWHMCVPTSASGLISV